MRTIHTFIIRLLVDDETPNRIRGALQTIINPQSHTFQNGQELLGLLAELSPSEPASLPPTKCDSEVSKDLLQSEGES